MSSNSQATIRYRERLREKPIPAHSTGRYWFAKAHRCKCDLCRKAVADYNRSAFRTNKMLENLDNLQIYGGPNREEFRRAIMKVFKDHYGW